MIAFLRQLFCRHRGAFYEPSLMATVIVLRCPDCGKIKRRPDVAAITWNNREQHGH